MTFLTLVRHGATDAGRAHIIQGCHLNGSLNELGRIQAMLAARRLARYRPLDIYASPLQRAQETAAIIAEELETQYETLPELRERDFGIYEGLSRQELIALRQSRGLSLHDPTNQFPSGEAGVEAHEEVVERWKQVTKQLSPGRLAHEIALITHAGFIRCALYSAWGIDDGYPKAIRIREGSFVRAKLYPENTLEMHELWPNPVTVEMISYPAGVHT